MEPFLLRGLAGIWITLKHVYFGIFENPYGSVADFLCRHTTRADLGQREPTSTQVVWLSFARRCGLECGFEAGTEPRATLPNVLALLVLLFSGRTLASGPQARIFRMLEFLDELWPASSEHIPLAEGVLVVHRGKLNFEMLAHSSFPSLAARAIQLAEKWGCSDQAGVLRTGAVLLRSAALHEVSTSDRGVIDAFVGALLKKAGTILTRVLRASTVLSSRPPADGIEEFLFRKGASTTRVGVRTRARKVVRESGPGALRPGAPQARPVGGVEASRSKP